MCSRLARKSVTVPVRGIRLHHEQQNEAIRMVKDVTVPVRGIRLHLSSPVPSVTWRCCCPREGYKVASLDRNDNSKKVYTVTVPVRGIRLHPEPALCNVSREPRVTVPVRGSRGDRCQRQKQGATAGAALRVLQAPCRCAAKIGKAQEEKVASGQGGTTRCRATSYCPREGYKVASTCSRDISHRMTMLLSP